MSVLSTSPQWRSGGSGYDAGTSAENLPCRPIPSTSPSAVTKFGNVRPVVTTQAIVNAKGIKILDQGVAINAGLYERLMEHRLSAPLEDSVSSLPTVNGHALRSGIEEIADQTPFFARMLEDRETRGILLNIVERIHLPDPIAFQLTMAQQIRPSRYQHLLSTTLTASWLAISSGMSRLQLRVAATAGLLHDLGMPHLAPQLLEYKSRLDRPLHRQPVSHPLVSSALIEQHKEYSKEVVRQSKSCLCSDRRKNRSPPSLCWTTRSAVFWSWRRC